MTVLFAFCSKRIFGTASRLFQRQADTALSAKYRTLSALKVRTKLFCLRELPKIRLTAEQP